MFFPENYFRPGGIVSKKDESPGQDFDSTDPLVFSIQPGSRVP